MHEDDVLLHELDHADFQRKVRSFEHWFGAVDGYLHGLHNGHAALEEERATP